MATTISIGAIAMSEETPFIKPCSCGGKMTIERTSVWEDENTCISDEVPYLKCDGCSRETEAQFVLEDVISDWNEAREREEICQSKQS